jgi:hypothetical protein
LATSIVQETIRFLLARERRLLLRLVILLLSKGLVTQILVSLI